MKPILLHQPWRCLCWKQKSEYFRMDCDIIPISTDYFLLFFLNGWLSSLFLSLSTVYGNFAPFQIHRRTLHQQILLFLPLMYILNLNALYHFHHYNLTPNLDYLDYSDYFHPYISKHTHRNTQDLFTTPVIFNRCAGAGKLVCHKNF